MFFVRVMVPFHLSLHENICTMALITIHYLHIYYKEVISKFITALDHRSLASHRTYSMFKSNTYTMNTQGATTLHITINITV